jgi:hypothetical protein
VARHFALQSVEQMKKKKTHQHLTTHHNRRMTPLSLKKQYYRDTNEPRNLRIHGGKRTNFHGIVKAPEGSKKHAAVNIRRASVPNAFRVCDSCSVRRSWMEVWAYWLWLDKFKNGLE